jgi:hypothetical protein
MIRPIRVDHTNFFKWLLKLINCFQRSFSRHRFRHSTLFALILCLLTRYLIPRLLQLPLMASVEG